MKVECCICLEDFLADAESKVVTPKCGHLFHELCIDAWLKQNSSCPQCRLAVVRRNLQIVHLTATVTSSRRSSIFNSSLCEGYREVNENLLAQQERNVDEIEKLKEQVRKLTIEIEMMKKSGISNTKNGLVQNERQVPHLVRQQSLDAYKNVKSIVAMAWKKKD